MACWRTLNTARTVLPFKGQRTGLWSSCVCRIQLQIRVLSSGKPVVGMEVSSGIDSKQEPGTVAESSSVSRQEVKKPRRQFNFQMYNKRHVALKLAYVGWDYHGFASQDQAVRTIEDTLFECLQKTKLVEDPHNCKYSRCGRTDKGVSGLGQVVSLLLRSNLLKGFGVVVPEGSKADERKGDESTEIPYMHILNNVLPDDIRVLAWAPVGPDFSARFSCLHRTYKYFFPRGNMDVDLMREAAQKFVGEHDFRNFCKMDIAGGVTNFRRRVLSFEVNILSDGPPSPYQLCEITISGLAFLWHQVRCMVAILFLVGNQLEKPELIDHMLDIEVCPRKPQYGMASEYPLILYDCVFEDVNWERDESSYTRVVSHFQQLWTMQAVKTTMLRRMLDSLELSLLPSPSPLSHMAPIMQSDHKLGSKSYKPLLARPTADTFEERYEYHKAKKRKKMEESESTEQTS